MNECQKLSQYRSIYLNKKFKFSNNSGNSVKQTYDVTGSVGERGANTPHSLEKKRRSSNSSSFRKTDLKDGRASTLFNNEFSNDVKIAKKYLLKINEFQWYLVSVPCRFLLNPLRNKPIEKLFSKSIYCILSLKLIDLSLGSGSGGFHDIESGLIELQANFNQAEYSLVSILRLSDFLIYLKTLNNGYEKSLIKQLAKISKLPKTEEKSSNQQQAASKKNRRASIRPQDKVKVIRLQKFHSLTIE